MEPAKSQLKKGEIPPTTDCSQKMTDDRSPSGGQVTRLEMRHLLNICGVRSADALISAGLSPLS